MSPNNRWRNVWQSGHWQHSPVEKDPTTAAWGRTEGKNGGAAEGWSV